MIKSSETVFLISVANYNFDKSKQCIGSMTIEIDFLQKKSTDSSPYDSDKMAAEFIQHFNNQGFSVGQQVRITSQKLNKGYTMFNYTCLLRFSCHSWSSVSVTNSLA